MPSSLCSLHIIHEPVALYAAVLHEYLMTVLLYQPYIANFKPFYYHIKDKSITSSQNINNTTPRSFRKIISTIACFIFSF